MLKTKLYQKPFFFTVHQKVNKPKTRAAKTVYRPMIFPFNVIIINIFFFLLRCKDKRIKLCYIKLQFVKETQIKIVLNTKKLFNNNNNNKYPETRK